MPLSCYLFRPRKSREKRRKRSHTNVFSTLSTRSSTPPAQTPHVRFRRRKRVQGTHSPSPTGSHTAAHTAKQGPSLPRPQHGLVLPAKFLLVRHAFIYIHFPVLCDPHYIKSGRVTVATLPQTVSHPAFQLLLQTAHVCLHSRKRVHTCLRQQDRTQRLTRRNTGRFGWGRYYYLRHVLHVHEHPRAGCQNGVLCRFGILAGRCSRRTQKAFGTAMRLCASLSRGVAAPLGCVIFSVSVEIAACMPCAQGFLYVRGGDGITTLGVLCVLLKRRTAACQSG